MFFFCFHTFCRGKKLTFFFILVTFCPLIPANAREFETWTSIGAETEFRNIVFSLENANFFLANGDWYLNFSQFTFNFPLEHNFRFGLGYKQEYVKTPEKLRTEYRPMVQLFYIKTVGAWNFCNRNRWEFRCMEGDLINRYRNQLRISYLKLKKIAPYCSTESFFYFNDFRFNRQRSFIGANIFVSKIIFDLYLGHQINEHAPRHWENESMLGTSLTYRF
jgi:hypothetical protein